MNAQVSIQHTPTAPHPRGRLGWRRLLVAPLAVLALLCVAAPAQAYIYWGTVINGYSGTIGRANLDGTGANESFITEASDPYGVAVDGAHIYWANEDTGTIGRANLDGTGVNQSFITTAGGLVGVAVDGAHIYWTNYDHGMIGRANLDGTNVAPSFVTGLQQGPSDLAVDALGPVRVPPPKDTVAPKVTGTAKTGSTLSCSTGSWTNNPTAYAYQWYRNGTLLAGFISSTYTLGTLDEGTTLTCVVTASNAAGDASATSNAVKIPIPKVPHCPAATGYMTGTTIGQIRLGITRSRARYLYRHHSNRGKQFEDFFCLTPIGVRVGYATPILLKTVRKQTQRKLRGRVVWSSTSNPYYSLDGIRAGQSIATAARLLGTEPPFHIGLNYWYLARKANYTAVLKVRGTVVQELGIADNALTKTRKTQNVLMHSFY